MFLISMSTLLLTFTILWHSISNLSSDISTMLQVVLVDCTHLHSTMIPKLNDIYKDIIEFVADESFKLAEDFIDDMKQIVKVKVKLVIS